VKLRDRELLAEYMQKKDFSMARMGRYCNRSRQFIWLLLQGERTTCSEEVGRLIEEALDLLPGTLFVPKESPVERPKVAPKRTSHSRLVDVA
jgi:hypothetical protein